MELENGLPFKFYFENIDKFGRVLPNNLSIDELNEYNLLCDKNYNWDAHINNKKTNKLINSFFQWIRDNDLITNDVKYEKLIYLCEAFTPVPFYDNSFIENLNKDIYDGIRNNKIIVLFNWFAEPLYDENFNKNIEIICETNGFDVNNFIVLTSANNIKNTSKLNYISDHFFLKNSADFLKHYLQNKIHKSNTFDYVCEIVNQDIFQTKKEQHFLCLNRTADRPHRYAFGLFLEKYNLWDKGIFTFLVCDNHKQNDELVEVFNQSTAEEYSQYKNGFHNKIPLEIDTKFLIEGNELFNFGTSKIYYKPIYEKTAINIVTETTFTQNKVFISEKTFHPIINLQPFIMFASNGQLQELRNLGFKTFGHIIDESYDNEEDNHIRFKMICDEILRLSKMNIDEINQLFLSCKDICIYNRNHLLSFVKYDVFENSLQKIKQIWNSKEKQF
jgi:hypothetical protein